SRPGHSVRLKFCAQIRASANDSCKCGDRMPNKGVRLSSRRRRSGSQMAEQDRYDGKPLLRLFEFYVLDAIDQLDEFHRQGLEKLAPKLQKTFGGNGDWRDAIAAAGLIPPEWPEAIRGLWAKNLEGTLGDGTRLSPQEFAEMFVDMNLSF